MHTSGFQFKHFFIYTIESIKINRRTLNIFLYKTCTAFDCIFISWNRIAQNANYPNAVTTWNGFYRWNCNENKMHTYTLLTPKKNARKWTVISEVQRKELPTTSTHTLKISMPRLCYYARFYVRHCMEIAMKLSKPCGWKYLVLRIENFHLLDT